MQQQAALQAELAQLRAAPEQGSGIQLEFHQINPF